MDTEYLISHWRTVCTGLLETVAQFTDSDLDFRPFETAWTVRQLMLHVAHEERGEFAYGIAQELSEFPPAYPPEEYPTVESIRSLLQAVHVPISTYLSTLGEADLRRVIVTPWNPSYPLIERIRHLIEHEIHHRGELSLILGMLGKKGLGA